MFKKVLVANRGEIACRVIRTLKRLGIGSVAVYSEADKHALHVRMADEAYFIGPSASLESYLNQEVIINVGIASNVNAIHPGYGFLSENADFANRCQEAGLIFIGPKSETIRLMGEKDIAKELMKKANVPVLPGFQGDQDFSILKAAAEKMGFPLLIKPVAGGGGKGMRLVLSSDDFEDALKAAKRESKASFDNDKVMLEKYIQHPRHIEVQIMADKQGNTVYLFERDCSIQRRYQKILEEATAPLLDKKLRDKINTTAVTAAKAVGYLNAGTVEFLFDPVEKLFYFMEMNTRLQVEHPVTEAITGVDVVEWQLRISSDEILPISKQQAITFKGHAIEARIYAEDPLNQFSPSAGKLVYFKMPKENQRIRIDTGYQENDEVSIYYDSLLAKLIAYGKDRATAIKELINALNEIQIVGVKTNVDFLSAIVKQSDFKKADVNTHFIEEHPILLRFRKTEISAPLIVFASIAILLNEKNKTAQLAQYSEDFYSPWFQHDIWRLYISGQQTIDLAYDSQKYRVCLYYKKGLIYATLGKEGYEIRDPLFKDQYLTVDINGEPWSKTVVFDRQEVHIFDKEHYQLKILDGQEHSFQEAESASHLLAPMPGTIVSMMVSDGQKVKKGDRLLVIEAMKMEHTLFAPATGVIQHCRYKEGDLIQEGVELLSLIPSPLAGEG